MKKRSSLGKIGIYSAVAITGLSLLVKMADGVNAYAEEYPDIIMNDDIEYEAQYETSLSDDEALMQYMTNKVTNDNQRKTANIAEPNLTGINKEMYFAIKPKILNIAAGKELNTKITVSLESLGYADKYWTASDLGVSQIVSYGSITTEAQSAVAKLLNYDPEKVVNAIVKDCPYEMFWGGNSYTYGYIAYSAKYDYDLKQYVLRLSSAPFITFHVADDYKGADTEHTDITKILKVDSAVRNAKDIVAAASGKSDYDKLVYYRDKIIEMVDYNDDAANGLYTSVYGNPWQLIWVFDGDPSTKVVCEGYSKAFSFLCEMTKFQHNNIYCMLTSGEAILGGTTGGHMWNVIHMDDGCNYLVDVTNCDEGGSAVNDWLFILNPTSSTAAGSNVFRNGTRVNVYQYDASTLGSYSKEQLTLSTHPYEQGKSIDESPSPSKSPTQTPTGSPSKSPQSTPTGSPSQSPQSTPTSSPAVSPVPSKDPVIPNIDTSDANPVRSFVKRLYVILLGREAEESGLNDWTQRLESGAAEASQIVEGIANSDEFMNKHYSSDELVERMYLSMLDRKSDAEGKADWVGRCNNGMSVNAIINGFSGSAEFGNICSKYGIKPGSISLSEPRDQNPGVTGFVARCYVKALGRDFDLDGLNDWCGRILSSANPRQAALDMASGGFFHSQEFANKNTSNDEYVEILYRTFLGREFDPAGKADWVGQLNNGVSRDQVLGGFSGSAEFDAIMKNYGL